MRRHLSFLVGLTLLTACGQAPSGANDTSQELLALVPDYAESMAYGVDGAGIGAVGFPDNLKLSTEQKASLAALHEAFKAATAAEVAALKAVEAEARAAMNAGKTRNEVRAILARGAPFLVRIGLAFATLQAAIMQVYTPEQREWIAAHRPKPCGPGGPPTLSDQQMQEIRALQQAFMEAVKDDIASIRRVAEAAHQAAQAGASRDRVQEILRQADAARERVRQAEMRLQAAIDGVLTPEQRARKCVPQRP
jgi:Spy/CpxP family protein refolding chaperone